MKILFAQLSPLNIPPFSLETPFVIIIFSPLLFRL